MVYDGNLKSYMYLIVFVCIRLKKDLLVNYFIVVFINEKKIVFFDKMLVIKIIFVFFF